jgi:hypothetical protein
MLRYEAVKEEDGLRVTFLRPFRLGDLIPAAIFTFFADRAWRDLVQTLYTTTDTLHDHLVFAGFMLYTFAAFASLSVILGIIVRMQIICTSSGITFRQLLFGIPIRSRWFDVDEIYNFGHGHVPHTSVSILRFSASGTHYRLAFADGPEIDDFLIFLKENGLAYSDATTSSHRVSGANTFLRQ